MSFAADSAAQQAPMIGRLCVIGVGLIGGSLVAALRERGLVGEVVGCARRAETLATAEYLGLIDRGETDPAAAIAGADVVVIAVPRAVEWSWNGSSGKKSSNSSPLCPENWLQFEPAVMGV